MVFLEVAFSKSAIAVGFGGMCHTHGGRGRTRIEEGGLLSGDGWKVDLACIRAIQPNRLKELKAWILNIHPDGEKADKRARDMGG